MAWEIGKEYSCRNGVKSTLVAFASDGRLILEHHVGRNLVYRNPDGRINCTDKRCNGSCNQWDVIDPDEVAPEELEIFKKLVLVWYGDHILGFRDETRVNIDSDYMQKKLKRLVPFIRELKGDK